MKYCFILFVVLNFFNSSAQFATSRSRSELGVMLGGTFYIGDLNPYTPYRNTNIAGGLVYRFSVNPRVAIRVNALYGSVNASDADANDVIQQDRNLSFHSDIYELAGGVEINYFPFQIGHKDYKGTAYLVAQLGVFRMDPKTYTDSGNEVALNNLGTEGQGTALNSDNPYNLTQICMPLGVGMKVSLGKSAALSFEIGIRKTFTDFLDDVHSAYYSDPNVISEENGDLAAQLSNRSLSSSRYGERGDPKTKDWYVFSGAMLTFRLGQPKKCFGHR